MDMAVREIRAAVKAAVAHAAPLAALQRCVDGSTPALCAARLALELALGWQAAVRAICVIDDRDLALIEQAVSEREDLREQLRPAAKATIL